MTSQLFASPSSLKKPAKVFGTVENGRYHMPLLPGEQGPKDGSPHVSRGLMRMTNLAGALEDTRALSVWEQAMGLIGLALAPELYQELCGVVASAAAQGVDFEVLREYPWLREALAGQAHDQEKQKASLIGRAKSIAGADAAAQRGTADHDAWETRSKTGALSGTGRSRGQVVRTEALLAEAGLVRVPGLSERVVRNMELGAVGKFDDVLMEESTGRLLMADLKTKATAFYSWTSVDVQLAGYARAEWMLTPDGQGYEPGPLHHVDQSEGVILHVPQDGAPARLERADLTDGWTDALLAKRIIERRSSGRSADRFARSEWVPKNLAATS